MTTDIVPFQGWQHNLRLANADAELIITLDVGPRVLSYRLTGGESPLKIFQDQMGTTGDADWVNRGGHRLWLAPESRAFTYVPDNAPVPWQPLGSDAARLTPPVEAVHGLQKQLDVHLAPAGSGVTIVHRVVNVGDQPRRLAPWALTVMAAGGVAILPQPPLGEHPRDLLPNRKLVLWPYSDPSDPRWHLGRHFITLRQDAAGTPTKFGLAHAPGWAAYAWHGLLFHKRFDWQPDAEYVDMGCNFETFTNARMLELESLGPLITLEPGATVEHTEQWQLLPGLPDFDPRDDDATAAALAAVNVS